MVDVADKTIISIWKAGEDYAITIESIFGNRVDAAVKLTQNNGLINDFKVNHVYSADNYHSYFDKYNLKKLTKNIKKPLIAITIYGLQTDFDLDGISNCSSIFRAADRLLDKLGYDDYYQPNGCFLLPFEPHSFDDFCKKLSNVKRNQLAQYPETAIEEPYYQTKIIKRINKQFIVAHSAALTGEVCSIIFGSLLLSENTPIDHRTISSTVGGCLIAISIISVFSLHFYWFSSIKFVEYLSKEDSTFEQAIEHNQTTTVQI